MGFMNRPMKQGAHQDLRTSKIPAEQTLQSYPLLLSKPWLPLCHTEQPANWGRLGGIQRALWIPQLWLELKAFLSQPLPPSPEQGLAWTHVLSTGEKERVHYPLCWRSQCCPRVLRTQRGSRT